MKKVLSGMIAAVMTICMSVSVFASPNSSVSIKNNDSKSTPVTYEYAPDQLGETVRSIKPLMTKLDDLSKQSSVVQTLTISSESAEGDPVDFKLRLSMSEKTSNDVKPEVLKTPSPDEYNALNYYNIKVTDSNNKLIYSYANDDSKTDNGTYKDIPLGTMNSSANTENKIINVTVLVNKSLKNSDAEQYAEKLDWSIVSSVKKTETAETPKATEEVAKETTAPTTEVVPKETTNPSAKEDKNGVVTLAQGEYICGEDIDPGRYTMTGNGKVHVYTENGELKSTIALKDKNSSANGVEEYLINLTDGEKIKVESETKFTPYTATATAKPKATSTASSSTKATTKPTATPKTTAKPSKNNPKTGDNTPIVALVSVGILAAGAFVFIEIKKRKNN